MYIIKIAIAYVLMLMVLKMIALSALVLTALVLSFLTAVLGIHQMIKGRNKGDS